MATSDEYKRLASEVKAAKAAMDKMLDGASALQRSAIKRTDEYRKQVTILKEGNEQLKEMKYFLISYNSANRKVL